MSDPRAVTSGPEHGLLVYREERSALRWPLLVLGLVAPTVLLVLCVVLGVLADPVWFVGAFFVPCFLPFMVYEGLLYRNWPVGILIHDSTVTIGAIRSARGPGRNPTVNHQGWGVYSCPRAAISSARVVTDPMELCALARSPRYATMNNRWGSSRTMSQCMVGVLCAPFMRAALVIELDPGAVTGTPIRPARFYSNRRSSRILAPGVGDTWIVPTRRPESLAEALAGYL